MRIAIIGSGISGMVAISGFSGLRKRQKCPPPGSGLIVTVTGNTPYNPLPESVAQKVPKKI
jgi:hypothetical protein